MVSLGVLLREEQRVLWSGCVRGVFYRALWRGGRASILLCLRSDAEGDAKGRKSDLICLISGEVPMKLPSVD